MRSSGSQHDDVDALFAKFGHDDLGEAMVELFDDLIGGSPRDDLTEGAEAPASMS